MMTMVKTRLTVTNNMSGKTSDQDDKHKQSIATAGGDKGKWLLNVGLKEK
jgi:hypothetical protein